MSAEGHQDTDKITTKKRMKAKTDVDANIMMTTTVTDLQKVMMKKKKGKKRKSQSL